eukprot:225597-Amphidinium_carterae.1
MASNDMEDGSVHEVAVEEPQCKAQQLGSLDKAQLSARTVLHRATGHLMARLPGIGLDPCAFKNWIEHNLAPLIKDFIASGGVIKQAVFDLSHNHVGDRGVAELLDCWLQLEQDRSRQQEEAGYGAIAARANRPPAISLQLQNNNLTDATLAKLRGFVEHYAGEIRELHLNSNAFSDANLLLELLHSLTLLPQYPLWIKRQRRYAPVFLKVSQCGLTNPDALLKAIAAAPLRVCLMEDPTCTRTTCKHAGIDRMS